MGLRFKLTVVCERGVAGVTMTVTGKNTAVDTLNANDHPDFDWDTWCVHC
jgi:hypothetical protein